MNELHQSFEQRFRNFFQHMQQFDWKTSRLWLYFGGWMLAFFLGNFPGANFLPDIILFAGFIFLWFMLVEQICKKIQPPPELLLAILWMLFVLEYLFFSWFSSPTLKNAPINTGVPGDLFQTLILSLFVLTFSVLIVRHKKTNRGILVVLLFIAIPIESLIESNNEYFILFFELILFFLLLNRTAWLEQLSKAECWIYLGIFIFLFQLALWLDPFTAVDAKTFQETSLWFSFPKFLYILFLCYLAALIVKIPGVLIFNHASLSRKLWISSLFQSTFPQIFQLIALLIIFYIFITVWQAQNIRNALQFQLENVQKDSVIVPFDYYILSSNNHNFNITWEGYQHKNVSGLPEKGVLELQRSAPQSPGDSLATDFFLFTRADSAGTNDFIYLIKIDDAFLRETLAEKMNFLGGSSLLCYAIAPKQWLLHSEKIHLWQTDKNVRIFPFSLVDYRKVHPLRISLNNSSNVFENTNFTLGFLAEWPLTFGRVLVPIWDSGHESSYLAFDVVLDIRPNFQWTDLLTLVLVAMVLYMLMNVFIIRRMISFGSQINKIIVQKFKQLKNGIQQISGGNFDYKIHFEGDDEFVELAESFNRMGERLHETMEERREKDRLQFELQSARNVQISLLPRTLPDVPGYEIAASLHTATEVGGDFYDIFPLDADGKSGRFLFAVGDVSGKGSSAALYMAQCMSLIRYSRQFTDNPKKICLRLNAYFASEVEDRRIFVTMIMGLLDTKQNKLIFVRAGHTEPVFIPGDPKKSLNFLSASGLGIGLTNRENLFDKTLQVIEIAFEPGDTLVFYTDGVIEASRPAKGGAGKETFDESQLIGKLAQSRGKSAALITSDISTELDNFYAEYPRVDDHTIFIIRRNK